MRSSHRGTLKLAGALMVLLVFGFSALVIGGFLEQIFAGSSTQVEAQFSNAGLLSNGDPVRIDGVQVGQVSKITLNPGGHSATVQMNISGDDTTLYSDASAQLAWRTVLGGTYAINLSPGTVGSGRLNGDITLRHTSTQVEVDQVLSTFGHAQRAGLQDILSQTHQALTDPNGLASAVGAAADASPSLDSALDDLRGVNKDADLENLITNTSRAVTALDQPRQVQDVIQSAALMLNTTDASSGDISATLSDAARTLAPVRVTLGELNHTLGLADPLIAQLMAPAGDVAPTLEQLRPTLNNANALLKEAEPLLTSLKPAAGDLARASQQGLPLLTGLTPSISRLANNILPDLAKVPTAAGSSKRPTYELIGPAIEGLAGLGAQEDSVSHIAQLAPSVGTDVANPLPCQIGGANPTASQLIDCQEVSTALTSLLSPGTPSLSSSYRAQVQKR